MSLIYQFAPAKINLYLHITGRRADGYHDLDSLVVFANIGDMVAVRRAERFHLEVTGPQAGVLAETNPEDNLAVRAARSLAELTGNELKIHLLIVKNLPVASGIGGGSSDAAATLHALAQHWHLAPEDPRLLQAAVRHGQDVPVCLCAKNIYMTASGILPAPALPTTGVVLVNPGRGLSTPDVYREYKNGGDAFSPLSPLTHAPTTIDEMVEALQIRGNDLYAPACRLMPEIAGIIDALDSFDDCLLARMSGSGATCFGLYADASAALSAAAQIRALRPHWWVEAGKIN